MCLIVFSFQASETFPLVVAANRDEFYQRPASPLHQWKGGNIIAGRDEEKGGTWMGVTKEGRFAAVTNIRKREEAFFSRSRGELVTGFLEAEEPANYLTSVQLGGDRYAGFNFIAGGSEELSYATNQQKEMTSVSPGIYGVSNAALNTPWPKVNKAKKRFSEIIEHSSHELKVNELFDMLSDRENAPKNELPDTGVGEELEHSLSPIFINMSGYGTRAQTVFAVRNDGFALMEERTFGENGEFLFKNRLTWNTREKTSEE